MRDEGSCTVALERGIQELDHLDIQVNNAGGSYMFPFFDTSVDRIDTTWR